jgi:hypothetical protein
MPSLNAAVNATLLGLSFNMDQSVTGDNGGIGTPSVGPALAGTLTTRTDNDTGVVTATVGTGHGIISTDMVDLYWDGGSRHNMTATVAGAAITLDGGAGDNLPVLNTAVTFMKPDVEEHIFTGDDCFGFGVTSPDYPATVVFQEAGGTEIFAVELDAGESYVWSSQSAVTNPLAGAAVGQISYSHGSTVGASTLGVAYVRS